MKSGKEILETLNVAMYHARIALVELEDGQDNNGKVIYIDDEEAENMKMEIESIKAELQSYEVAYGNTGTSAFLINGTYLNACGQTLRSPENYEALKRDFPEMDGV